MAKQQTPGNNLLRLVRRLSLTDADSERFIHCLTQPDSFPVAVVDVHGAPGGLPFTTEPSPEWFPKCVCLVTFDQRPGRSELHEAGAIYCLDPASVFMASPLRMISEAVSSPPVVLDLCSSPGGKAVLASCLVNPAELWCNEVIGKRLGALAGNLKRCRIPAARMISHDPRELRESCPACAEVVIVDAPCSGQSLIARGTDSPGCFHPATINANANRQRRILADAAALVRPGGWLLYSTCTFSLKENERNADWLTRRFPFLHPVEVPFLEKYRSPYSSRACYRMMPEPGVGAGGFTALWRREGETGLSGKGALSEFARIRWSRETSTDRVD